MPYLFTKWQNILGPDFFLLEPIYWNRRVRTILSPTKEIAILLISKSDKNSSNSSFDPSSPMDGNIRLLLII